MKWIMKVGRVLACAVVIDEADEQAWQECLRKTLSA